MRAINKKYEELGKMTVHEIQVKLKITYDPQED